MMMMHDLECSIKLVLKGAEGVLFYRLSLLLAKNYTVGPS